MQFSIISGHTVNGFLLRKIKGLFAAQKKRQKKEIIIIYLKAFWSEGTKLH